MIRKRYDNNYIHNNIGLHANQRIIKPYCVIIAAKGKPIYPLSKPVISTSKRFSRGVEPEKLAIEMRHLGVYNDREEAELVFSKGIV